HRPPRARRRHRAGPAGVKLVWDESAWADYAWWQAQDRKVLKRINQLITDLQRNGNEGIGKPEPLKHGFQGYWSRRINDEHRLIYKATEDRVLIAHCRYHSEVLRGGSGPGGGAQPRPVPESLDAHTFGYLFRHLIV